MGLETSSDTIREKCINKGFVFRDFDRCRGKSPCRRGRSQGVPPLQTPLPDGRRSCRGYGIIHPGRIEARRDDLHESLHGPAQDRTRVLLETGSIPAAVSLERSYAAEGAPVHVSCDPLGGGQKRGPHNCGKCDYEIVKGIRDYSLNADRDLDRRTSRNTVRMPRGMGICSCKREAVRNAADPVININSFFLRALLWISSCRASSGRNVPASDTTPIAWVVPRSMSLVSDAGFISTHTVFTFDGR